MMRTLHLVTSLKMGGLENMVLNLANTSKFHTEVCIINDQVDEDLFSKIKVSTYRINRKESSRSLFSILQLFIFMYRKKYEIVHVHNFASAKIAVFFKKFFHKNLKIIYTIHDSGDNIFVSKGIDKYVSISKSGIEKVKQVVMTDNVEVIRNGIDTFEFHCEKLREPRKSNFIVGMLSRIDIKQKGHDILFEAIRMLQNKNIITLKVGGDFTLQKEFMEEIIDGNDLKEHTKLMGYINNPVKFYQEIDLLVLPSREEGFGLVIAEALMAGVPVIVSDLIGPMEIINHGEYGLYFKSENPQDLSIKIEEIIKNYPDKDHRRAAQIWIEREFNFNTTIKNYEKLYMGFYKSTDTEGI